MSIYFLFPTALAHKDEEVKPVFFVANEPALLVDLLLLAPRLLANPFARGCATLLVRKTAASLDFHELTRRGFDRRLACKASPNALLVPENKLLDVPEEFEAADVLRLLLPNNEGAGNEALWLLVEKDN